MKIDFTTVTDWEIESFMRHWLLWKEACEEEVAEQYNMEDSE